MKRAISILLAALMLLALTACGGTTPNSNNQGGGDGSDSAGDTFKIGIVTGTVSQSEDDRRGAEAFQEMYGEDRVVLATYPDNFTEEVETTIQRIAGLADDPDIKAIVVNQAVPGTTEAFRQIKERRPDIL